MSDYIEHDGMRFATATIPISDEMFIDAGIGTPAQRREVLARMAIRRAASEARWRALPFYVRWSRIARGRWWPIRERLAHAGRALRGEECER